MTDKKTPASPTDAKLPSASRRGVLFGIAASGAGLGLPTVAKAEQNRQLVADETAQPLTIPFHGPRQSGITMQQPHAGLLVAFEVLADTRQELQDLFVLLTQRFAFLMQGGKPEQLDPGYPALDSGLLGPTIIPERLTMTVALGSSLFDGRFGFGGLKPKHLAPMDSFQNDALDAELCHGDVMIQICAETPEETIHALRDIVRNTPDMLAVKWKQEGFTATHGRRTGPVIGAGRNLLGFKDGTANADITRAALMEDYVWVQPSSEEPGWTKDGTYQVVRIIRNFVERWDRTPLGEQERIIGRHRDTGAPLGKAKEFDDPAYAEDPNNERIPVDAHIRLANPRVAGAVPKLIRRGFNYSNGISKSGQLDMGLVFISFQNDMQAGFISVQKRLDGEPLEEYIKPVGGGYFFVLPGVPDAGSYLGKPLFEAAAAAHSIANDPPQRPDSPNKG